MHRGAETTDQKREREREKEKVERLRVQKRSEGFLGVFFFGGALGGFAWDTCAHVDQHIRHIKYPANPKSEASKHHLEPGN